MRTKTAKLISALAMAGVLAFTSTAVYAEEAASTVSEQQTLETYIPTNDDEEFPFNMEINVMPESIQYIELDEPIYGFERILDSEALVFDVEFSLKDEFKDFDRYEFQVYSSDYSEEIASEYLEKDEVLTLSGLSIGTGYKLSMKLETEPLTASYGGQFVIQAEWGGSLAVDLFYQLAHMEGDAAPFANEMEESDTKNVNKNANINTPDNIVLGRDMVGWITAGDEDYFMFGIPNKVSEDDPDEIDLSGIANVSLTIEIPMGKDLQVDFYDKNNNITFSYKAKTKMISHIIPNLSQLDICKLRITCDTIDNVKYRITSNYNYGLAWYGQHMAVDDANTIYWNINKLDTLKYNNKSIFQNSTSKEEKDNNSYWFKTACGVVASAMALKNMGATMEGYDFRTDYSGELQADPFTVMLASCNEDGTKMISSPTVFTVSSGTNPNILNSHLVAPKFNKSKTSEEIYKDINSLTGSTTTEDLLRKELKAHKYVVIYFNEDLYSEHFMLLTDLKSGSGTFAERATVCDPAAFSYNKGIGTTGKGLSLSETEWYKNNKSHVQLSTMIVYY